MINKQSPVKEIALEELDSSFRLTFDKMQKAIGERYFHYARSLAISLLDRYPNSPALRLMLRQMALVTKEREGSVLLANIKTALINAYHFFRNSPLKHLNRLERVLLKRPDCLYAHRSLAQVAIKKELWGTAALSLEAISTLNPKSTHEQVLLAKVYLQQGRVEESQNIIKTILENNPHHSDAGDLMKAASVQQTLNKSAWRNRS